MERKKPNDAIVEEGTYCDPYCPHLVLHKEDEERCDIFGDLRYYDGFIAECELDGLLDT